jgi:hypothetical protein
MAFFASIFVIVKSVELINQKEKILPLLALSDPALAYIASLVCGVGYVQLFMAHISQVQWIKNFHLITLLVL